MKKEEFKKYRDDFLLFHEVQRNASPHTVRAYKADLAQFLTFWDGLEKKEPTTEHGISDVVRRYVVTLFYRKIKKATLARKIACFKSLQHYLTTQGITLSLALTSPRVDKKLPVTLTVDEIFYLLDDIPLDKIPSKFPYRDRAIFELLYATGVRCAELAGIQYADVNFSEKTIRVVGKGNKERIVLFGSKAQVALVHYLEHERPDLAMI